MEGRLFTLDAQFLFDTVVLALSMLVLYTLLSYLLFNPVRDLLEKRKQRIADDREEAKRERAEALIYREEYEAKYGPLTANVAATDCEWLWINNPWPWERMV